jgi:hypothetical protein
MTVRDTVPVATVGDLSKLQDEILDLQVKYDTVKQGLEEVGADLDGKKRQMIEMMATAHLTNFKTPRGQIILNRKFTVPTPKGDDLHAFLGSLPDEVRRGLITVNYQTLNGWYKAEMDAAKERGDFDWKPAGLQEPTFAEYLSVKRT